MYSAILGCRVSELPCFRRHSFWVQKCLIVFSVMASAAVFADAPSSPKFLPETVSPNKKFSLAVGKLPKSDWSTNADGLTIDESLFIIDLKSKRRLREVSKGYRRASTAVWPKYEAAWSSDSTHLAAIARFRRSAALEAFAFAGNRWRRLNLPEFDVLGEMKRALSVSEPFTGESEIVSVEWDGVRQLKVRANAYLKTPKAAVVEMNYVYELDHGKWKSRLLNSSTRTD
jgi:hypothetical protein